MSADAPTALLAAKGNQAAQRLFASMGFRRPMVEMTRELEEATFPQESDRRRTIPRAAT